MSIRYSERLAEAGIEPSVGSKGDSYDNALAQTIDGSYKAELIHRHAPWINPTGLHRTRGDSLLNRHTFCEVTRLVDVRSFGAGCVICQQLQGHDVQHG